MRLDTKRVDRLIIAAADKVGVYINVYTERGYMPHLYTTDITTKFTVYVGNEITLEDNTVIEDGSSDYTSAKEVVDILELIKLKGIKAKINEEIY